jgi:hypothetical protein
MAIIVRYHLHKTCSDMKNAGIFLLVIICMMACKPTMLPPEPKEGDEWVYRFFDYDEAGNMVYSDDRYLIGGSSTLNLTNSIVPYVDIHMPGGYLDSPVPAGIFRMEPDGLHRILYTGYAGKKEVLYLKYPGAMGNSYEVNVGAYNQGMNITSISDSVSVPYGTLTGLYKYEISFLGQPTGQLWFNENVWFVKYEQLDSLTSGTGIYVDYAYELVSYTPH